MAAMDIWDYRRTDLRGRSSRTQRLWSRRWTANVQAHMSLEASRTSILSSRDGTYRMLVGGRPRRTPTLMGNRGASILLNIRIGRRPRHAMNVLLVMPTDRDGNAVSVSNESSSWYFRVLLWRKPSQRITSPEHASLTTLSMRLAVLMKDDRAHSTPQMANECSSYHRSSSGGQSLP